MELIDTKRIREYKKYLGKLIKNPPPDNPLYDSEFMNRDYKIRYDTLKWVLSLTADAKKKGNKKK